MSGLLPKILHANFWVKFDFFCIFIEFIASTFEFIVHSNLGYTYNKSRGLASALHPMWNDSD